MSENNEIVVNKHRGRPKGSKNKPKVTESAPSIENFGSKPTTAVEMKEWYEKNAKNTQNAFKQMRDVTKTARQTTLNSYSKDNVISYLQNISKQRISVNKNEATTVESSVKEYVSFIFNNGQIFKIPPTKPAVFVTRPPFT